LTADGPASRRLQFGFSGAAQEIMPRVESVELFLLDAGCTVASARNIAVVVEEILTNIARYAWPDEGRGACSFDAVAVVEPASVGVRLRSADDGIAFDPTVDTAPDLDAPLAERSAGGLGILLIKSMTDTQSYRRVGARNVFEVTRICPREPVE
jgi:serine/threonine-protein kinase RsbW